MHIFIASTTHEHATTAKVYTYEGVYEVCESEIRWKAKICHVETGTQQLAGTVPVTSPAIATVAAQVVRDEIVKRIDTFEDAAHQ